MAVKSCNTIYLSGWSQQAEARRRKAPNQRVFSSNPFCERTDKRDFSLSTFQSFRCTAVLPPPAVNRSSTLRGVEGL